MRNGLAGSPCYSKAVHICSFFASFLFPHPLTEYHHGHSAFLFPDRYLSLFVHDLFDRLGFFSFGPFSPPGFRASQITGLVSPQSMLADSGHGYFIANANGEPNDRDNEGFITKVDQTGTIVTREFIQGGRGTTILHSPKEMAILADILFVADVDTIRGFNKSTGESVTSFQ